MENDIATISKDKKIQKHYEELRANGVGHNMAEMIALQVAPGIRDTYSPMHPRRGRGKGGQKYGVSGKRK
jgi:hypothetical protein